MGEAGDLVGEISESLCISNHSMPYGSCSSPGKIICYSVCLEVGDLWWSILASLEVWDGCFLFNVCTFPLNKEGEGDREREADRECNISDPNVVFGDKCPDCTSLFACECSLLEDFSKWQYCASNLSVNFLAIYV